MTPMRLLTLRLLLALFVSAFFVQTLAADEDQSINPPDALMNAPSPVLTPQEALKKFVIEEGFEIQLVAAEPMVEDPVCMAWDEDGRLWVCEMRGYMPDQFGKGEEEPTGRIVILEDTDNDGVMDKHTVFKDNIVLPRAIAFAKGGLFYADFEKLYYVKINADGTAGFQQTVDPKYSNNGDKKSNVEHQANGLMYGLDNWYYSAKSNRRWKQTAGRYRPGATEFRGQWGITQDDDGRLLANTNSVLIQYELFPPSATLRNDNYKFSKPAILRADSEKVYPIHPTPGVNRGYQVAVVDHNTWKLKGATAVCGPVIYRADQFPAEYYNNVFIPEPAGNLLKRVVLTNDTGERPTAKQAYENKEFLASTDERNRFVNAYVGPDGCLYLVDMYRGLIQHKTYITDYLRRQINARQLDQPLGYGRIYRVVYKGKPVDHTAPKLSQASSEDLVKLLGHANAWHRETAQRLLVQRSDAESIPFLEAAATNDANPQAAIHALWTLEGMNKLAASVLAKAGETENERVRMQVLRLSERFEGTPEAADFVALMQRYSDKPSWELDLQLAFSAGVLASLDTPKAYDVLLGVLDRRGADAFFRGAIISGLKGKEAVMLAKVGQGPIREELTGAMLNAIKNGELTIGSLLELIDSKEFADQRDSLLGNLASQAVQQNRSDIVMLLVDRLAAADTSTDTQRSILQGMVDGRASRGNNAELDGKPALFAKWQASPPEPIADLVAQLNDVFVWEKTLISAELAARIENGRALYGAQCITCHGDVGIGQEGTAPPLAGADWVQQGSPYMLAAIVLNGLTGDIFVTVNGEKKLYSFQNAMTPFKDVPINDQDIADILTYIRSAELNNRASPVDAEVVAKVRELTKARRQPFTPAQLVAMKWPDSGEGPAMDFAQAPESHLIKASWLKHRDAGLVMTLLAVLAPLVLLLVLTIFGGGKPTEH